MARYIPGTSLILRWIGLVSFLLWFVSARGQVCDCLNCPQPLPPPGPDSCSVQEFILNVKGAENDDLSNPFQGVCGLQVHFQHNYVWSLSMCLISPGGDTLEFIGPSLTSGFASSALSSWDITFVQSGVIANPDPGFQATWSNFQLWEAFKKYTGTYHPSKGKLEDFDSGPVNGQWKILVKNCTELEKGTFINFSLIFCDDAGIDCNCQAFAGNLNQQQTLRSCHLDPGLDLALHPLFFGPAPDTSEYGYTYILSTGGVIQDYLAQVDLTTAPAGVYQVCGLSYLKEHLDSIPVPNDSLSVSDLLDLLFSDAPPFCGDITNKCLSVVISDPPAPVVLDTTLCSGQCLSFADSMYCQSVSVTQTLPTVSGCDSVVTLNLVVEPPQVINVRDTLCTGEFFIVGNNFYNQTGSYTDTLTTLYTGCDSIVNLDLFILNLEAKAIPQGMLSCQSPTVGISGLGSVINITNPKITWSPGGQILGGQGTLFAQVADPGMYALKLSKTLANGKTCTDSVAVTVQKDPSVPRLIGDTLYAYCEGNLVNLNQLGIHDQQNLGGSLTFHSGQPFDVTTQVGPVVDPAQIDTVWAHLVFGACADTLKWTWKKIPAPVATVLPSVTICNSSDGGVFNTLINFDTLILSANVLGSWANTDGAPVSGLFPILDFSGVPGPAAYTFTWTSFNASAPCTNIVRSVEIFVQDCACPSLAVLPPGPFCTSEAGILLDDLVLTNEPGHWTMTQIPAGGTNPAMISGDSLLVSGRDTGMYTLVFQLDQSPPPGCPDTAVLEWAIHAPPSLALQPKDTVCNQMITGEYPVTLDLNGLILTGDTGGIWAEVTSSGATGSGSVRDFTGVLPGTYTFTYATASAQWPCPDTTAMTSVTVLACACPPVRVEHRDSVCQDQNTVLLDGYVLQAGPGSWSLITKPAGSLPATLAGDTLWIQNRDPGPYVLVYQLGSAPPTGCPSSDTLQLMVRARPSAMVQFRDTVCNAMLSGSWSTQLDFRELLLGGDTSGAWTAILPVPGVSGTLPTLAFEDVPPGNYSFAYTTASAIPPCPESSYPVMITVVDCRCAMPGDTTLCNLDPDFDLDALLPNGIPTASWVIITSPPGPGSAKVQGSTLTSHLATGGQYFLKAVWNLPTGDPCPSEQVVSVEIGAPLVPVVRDSVRVCDMAGPYGSPELLMDSLFIGGMPAGAWTDLSGSGAGGQFPDLDFTGVAPGVYPFVFRAEDGFCPGASDTVWVVVLPCTCPPLNLSGPGSVCDIQDHLDLSAYPQFTDPGTWSLTWSPPGSTAYISGDTLVLTGGGTGLYELVFRLAQPPPPGCPDSANLQIQLVHRAEAGQFSEPSVFCAGVAVDLDLAALLSGGDPGGTWSTSPPIPGFNALTGHWTGQAPSQPGEVRILYAQPANGPCPADTAFWTGLIRPLPESRAGADAVIGCDMALPAIGDIGNAPETDVLYRWSLGGSVLGSGPAWIAGVPGIYVLEAVDTLTGCTRIDSVLVSQGIAGPTAMGLDVVPPDCGLSNGEVEVILVDGGLPPYLYRLDAGTWGQDPGFAGLGSGMYLLTVQDAQGCTRDTTVTLNAGGQFSVDLGPDLVVLPGTDLDLVAVLSGNPGPIAQVTWTPPDPGCAVCLNRQLRIDETTQVHIQVLSEAGCTASDDLVVVVLDEPVKVYIPTAFSPNGDGINDLFSIQGDPDLVQVDELAVFDRWGNEVFHIQGTDAAGHQGGWDGTYQGKPMDPGVFVYSCRVLLADGRKQEWKGEILLMR